MLLAAVQLWPPLVDINADMPPLKSANPTMTVPFGCTTGFTPMPLSKPAVAFADPQVSPPSLEVLICISELSHPT